MPLNNTTQNKIWLSAIGGAIFGAIALVLFQSALSTSLTSVLSSEPLSLVHHDKGSGLKDEAEQNKPLYWVAPMDDNYRRDKPGKSPMGMDLVPVYKEQNLGAEHGPGAVKIAPHVIHNLGVRTTKVAFETMVTEVATVGYVQYNEDDLIHIHPRVDGWIEKLFVKAAGNPVKQGEPLYTLYSPQLVNAQEELLIAIKRNNASLIEAAKQRLRALQLSPEFIQTLEQSQNVRQTITFYSPQSGVVDGLKIREGFYVKPGTTLLSIGKLDQVWVEAEVFERDAALIKEGLPVSMTLDYLPGKTWTGMVDYVYPTLNSQTRTLRVRLKFNNPEQQLKPNMFAQVRVHVKNDQPSIQVPKEAVIRTGKQDRVVMALGEGQYKSIAVTIGRVTQQNIEILSGLAEGDVVVTSAQFLIDSESSKSSDFKRMSVMSDASNASELEETIERHETVSSATVDGVINHISLESRVVNISRGPIEKWGRAAMTMDFVASDAIDLSKFTAGDKVTFTFEVRDEFVITQIAHLSEAPRAERVPMAPQDMSAHDSHQPGVR